MSETYASAFSGRYGDEAIQRIFSPMNKFRTWRRLWYTLADEQRKMGVPISDHAMDEFGKALDVTGAELRVAEAYEKETQHDVVAHIKVLGDICPTAKPFIHLGATSCYITDNTDIILMRDTLMRILERLNDVMYDLAIRGKQYAGTPTVGYTHYQPAQLTTVGKRFIMWADGFNMDAYDLTNIINNMMLLGCKGAVGTYSGMLPVLGSYERCCELDHNIAKELRFDGCTNISGQTYNRKQDSRVMAVMSGIAQSAYKFAQDIRLLAHDGEVYEMRGQYQVGSSAMPYKNNPINCERICGLARYVIVSAQNYDHTAATQWLERSLDDSSNRRVTMAEIFLATSEILILCQRVLDKLAVNTEVIARHVRQHLPNAVAEQIMADGVLTGGDRQEIHEQIRTGNTEHIERMLADDALTLVKDEVSEQLSPMRYIGCAEEQALNYSKHIIGGY